MVIGLLNLLKKLYIDCDIVLLVSNFLYVYFFEIMNNKVYIILNCKIFQIKYIYMLGFMVGFGDNKILNSILMLYIQE